jgi:Fic family protein
MRPDLLAARLGRYIDARTFDETVRAFVPPPLPPVPPVNALQLIRELHERLLRSGRGEQKDPGEFRTSQNWIGGTRPGNALDVPPPPDELPSCLAAFEAYLHDEDPTLPPLLKAGLIHVQFETLHPFLDGNGRIGRLLVTLYLCVHDVLRKPLLYLSLYLKAHRADYYRLLQEVRERGAWEAWLEFFLDGVTETATQAFDAATRIVDLFKADRVRIGGQLGARASSALRLHDALQENPFATSSNLVQRTGLTPPTVNAALEALQRLQLVREVTGKQRGRVFCYSGYLAILEEGTTPGPSP